MLSGNFVENFDNALISPCRAASLAVTHWSASSSPFTVDVRYGPVSLLWPQRVFPPFTNSLISWGLI